MSTMKKAMVTPTQAYNEGYFAAITRKPSNPYKDELGQQWTKGYAKGIKVVEFHTIAIRTRIVTTGLQSWEL